MSSSFLEFDVDNFIFSSTDGSLQRKSGYQVVAQTKEFKSDFLKQVVEKYCKIDYGNSIGKHQDYIFYDVFERRIIFGYAHRIKGARSINSESRDCDFFHVYVIENREVMAEFLNNPILFMEHVEFLDDFDLDYDVLSKKIEIHRSNSFSISEEDYQFSVHHYIRFFETATKLYVPVEYIGDQMSVNSTLRLYHLFSLLPLNSKIKLKFTSYTTDAKGKSYIACNDEVQTDSVNNKFTLSFLNKAFESKSDLELINYAKFVEEIYSEVLFEGKELDNTTLIYDFLSNKDFSHMTKEKYDLLSGEYLTKIYKIYNRTKNQKLKQVFIERVFDYDEQFLSVFFKVFKRSDVMKMYFEIADNNAILIAVKKILLPMNNNRMDYLPFVNNLILNLREKNDLNLEKGLKAIIEKQFELNALTKQSLKEKFGYFDYSRSGVSISTNKSYKKFYKDNFDNKGIILYFEKRKVREDIVFRALINCDSTGLTDRDILLMNNEEKYIASLLYFLVYERKMRYQLPLYKKYYKYFNRKLLNIFHQELQKREVREHSKLIMNYLEAQLKFMNFPDLFPYVYSLYLELDDCDKHLKVLLETMKKNNRIKQKHVILFEKIFTNEHKKKFNKYLKK